MTPRNSNGEPPASALPDAAEADVILSAEGLNNATQRNKMFPKDMCSAASEKVNDCFANVDMGYLRSKGFFDVEKHDLDVFCRYVIPFFE
jgi:hypothetical protein